MKHKVFTVALLSIAIFATGCSKDQNPSQKIETAKIEVNKTTQNIVTPY